MSRYCGCTYSWRICVHKHNIFFFYLRQIPLLFISVSSQLIYFYDPLFLHFFFLFLFKKTQEILSISSVYLYRVYYTAYSSGYYVIMVMMIIFLFRGGKRRRKNEFWKKKWIRKITEFELFRAIAPTPFLFYFIFFFFLLWPVGIETAM